MFTCNNIFTSFWFILFHLIWEISFIWINPIHFVTFSSASLKYQYKNTFKDSLDEQIILFTLHTLFHMVVQYILSVKHLLMIIYKRKYFSIPFQTNIECFICTTHFVRWNQPKVLLFKWNLLPLSYLSAQHLSINKSGIYNKLMTLRL